MVTKAYIHREHNCFCSYCHQSFYKTPSRITENNFCSLECRGLFQRNRQIVQCLTCQKYFEKINCNINRTEKSFCSTECYYKYPDKTNRFTCHRSKAEDYLYSLIMKDFPNLEIKTNDTDILNDNLEIDIAIPKLELAIELNGPAHYTNIYGADNLRKTQERDKRKINGLTSLNYQLYVIDISIYKNLKQAKPHIEQEYTSKIVPFITEKLNRQS